ncbi:hypothetical protein [Desulfovibrio ferrophilus]|uniref:Uncharacterized protein n=1 Tax=Desulfovibrio ferrophilus TaxID=241368 RepID=A0A2Z6AZ19_9BACT|nr:hypothetical protein [Desulfovibrio ferrophilus]BBD08425.1 hypothetical protein DFE_1699 [Desulfovibrio ferrophilus]
MSSALWADALGAGYFALGLWLAVAVTSEVLRLVGSLAGRVGDE